MVPAASACRSDSMTRHEGFCNGKGLLVRREDSCASGVLVPGPAHTACPFSSTPSMYCGRVQKGVLSAGDKSTSLTGACSWEVLNSVLA